MLTESEAEAELLRLWRSMDDRGRRSVMDVARFEAEAAEEARSIGWHVLEGGGSRKTDVIRSSPAETHGGEGDCKTGRKTDVRQS